MCEGRCSAMQGLQEVMHGRSGTAEEPLDCCSAYNEGSRLPLLPLPTHVPAPPLPSVVLPPSRASPPQLDLLPQHFVNSLRMSSSLPPLPSPPPRLSADSIASALSWSPDPDDNDAHDEEARDEEQAVVTAALVRISIVAGLGGTYSCLLGIVDDLVVVLQKSAYRPRANAGPPAAELPCRSPLVSLPVHVRVVLS